MKKILVVLLALATILAIAPVAKADSISGSIVVNTSQDPWTSTAITFNKLTGTGSAGSGDFTTVYDGNPVPVTVDYTPLTYASPSTGAFLTGTFNGKDFTFTITDPFTVQEFTISGVTYLVGSGTGVVSLTGYDDTLATFSFSANDVTGNKGSEGTSGFSLTIDANGEATPEPGSLILFGTGLVGIAGLLRRKYMVSR